MYGVIKEPNGSSAPELRAGFDCWWRAFGAGGHRHPAALHAGFAALPRRCPHSARRWYADGAGYSQVDDRRATNADVTSYGVAYTYPLSKRTDLNAVDTGEQQCQRAGACPGQWLPRRRDGVCGSKDATRSSSRCVTSSDFGLVDFSLLGACS